MPMSWMVKAMVVEEQDVEEAEEKEASEEPRPKRRTDDGFRSTVVCE